MKKILLLSFFIFSFSITKAQWVTLPDQYFADALSNFYGSCISGNMLDTTCSSILNEDTLYIGSWGISNLDGIQYFHNLIYLVCDGNSLTTLPPLPNWIRYLNAGFNQLTSITSFPDSLRYLYLTNNQLPGLPPLPQYLDTLYCQLNYLVGLPQLPDALTFLWVNYNVLTSVPAIPSSMRSLVLSNNNITAIPYLPPHLTDFFCQYNVITSLQNLPDSLHDFSIAYNPIQCLPPVLKWAGTNFAFDISNTNITCLPNIIQHAGYYPLLDTMPICGLFNMNGCEVGWNINGSINSDDDNNCMTTNDGSAIGNLKINLFDSGGNLNQQVIANWNGNFSFDTQLGTYTTSVDTSNIPFSVLCPSNASFISDLTTADSMDADVDFRFTCKPGFDIGAWNMLHYLALFPGNNSIIQIRAGDFVQGMYHAQCNSGISGVVKVVINGPANYLFPAAGALTPIVNGDTLIYIISDFTLLNTYTDFSFVVFTDTTALAGDQVCVTATVIPTVGDNNISNNTLTHCFQIVNSFDPNEKEVSPVGDLTYPYNDWLTYTIHFQNTGTAAAQHVQILDTLDTDLDESTFQLLSSSHDPMVQLFGNKVHFNFIAINLPDSATDSEGSKGYVSYRIKPLPNLPIGTNIENTASIYFDFNAPVVTNTTHSSFINGINSISNNSISFSFYPNPTSENITVEYNSSVAGTLNIYNLLGKQVQEISLEKSTTKKNISLTNIPTGIYFCVLRTADGKTAQQKLVVEK